MNFKRKIQLGIATATGMLVVGIVAVPSVTNVLHAASDNVSLVSQTAAPTSVKATNQTVKAISASGTKGNYRVKYAKAGTSSTTATYQQTNYNTKSDASNQVDYLANTQGQRTTLNSGTAATVQGTMGKVYVHWNTGSWSVTTIANTQDVAGNPTKFANQVNNQIQKQDLTNKNVTSGAVTVYDTPQNGQANSVQWQNGKQVAKVQGQQANTVIKIAANAKN
ncbi:hypothetical protein Nizo1840_1424 [Lactiplantibacillus plantarum]|nr:hypothetical protein Nizo1840_1424 [Lactiplantibacillus plantarum]